MPVPRTLTAIVAAVGLIIIAATLAGCSDDQPEISIEDHLQAIAGRRLTPAEVERQLEVATTMCNMDSAVLSDVWGGLSERQLVFQDFIFGTHCPERSVDYALATGRALNAEADAALVDRARRPSTPTSSTLPLPSSIRPPPSSSSSSTTTTTTTSATALSTASSTTSATPTTSVTRTTTSIRFTLSSVSSTERATVGPPAPDPALAASTTIDRSDLTATAPSTER